MQHLENMQHLREGIHWRSVGQRDPLVEYRSESQKLFESLQRTLRDEVLRTIFNVRKEELRPAKLEDDEYETELTKAARSAIEQGVNELGNASSHTHDDDFKVKKAAKPKAQRANAKRLPRKNVKQRAPAVKSDRSYMKHTVKELELKNGARGLLIHVPGAQVMSTRVHFRAGTRYVRDKSVEETAHIDGAHGVWG
jgi:hypothetical protein